MKICKKCLVEKEDTEFFKKREKWLEGSCKVCRKKREKELKDLDPDLHREKVRARSERRRKTEEWKVWRKDHQERNRLQISKKAQEYYASHTETREKAKVWRQENRERVNASIYKNKKKYPFKAAAREYVSVAIKEGVLTRPANCEKCHQECKPEAHHEDYFKPIEVQWLCKACHAYRHRKVL